MNPTLGITGASGYIGRALAARAQRRGYRIVALGRRTPADGMELRHADLSQPPPADLLDGLDAVVHLAANTQGDAVPADAEIRFSDAIAQHCAQLGIPLLVVSSLVAQDDAPSGYGRTKAAIERLALEHGAIVVRPGMVYGGRARGLYGSLARAVRLAPFIPDLRPRPWLQPVHVDDLADAMLAAIGPHRDPGRVWVVAGPPVSLGEFLSRIARHGLRIVRIRVPVPTRLLRALLAMSRPVAGRMFPPERLDSLTGLRPVDATADLRELGIVLRPLDDGLTRRGLPTRRLLQEGHALMRAFLGHAPEPFATRRYASVIARNRNGQALPVPAPLLRFPALIASLDSRGFRAKASSDRDGLAWRYAAAIRILETRTREAGAFLVRGGRRNPWRAASDGVRGGLLLLQSAVLAPAARWLGRGFL